MNRAVNMMILMLHFAGELIKYAVMLSNLSAGSIESDFTHYVPRMWHLFCRASRHTQALGAAGQSGAAHHHQRPRGLDCQGLHQPRAGAEQCGLSRVPMCAVALMGKTEVVNLLKYPDLQNF